MKSLPDQKQIAKAISTDRIEKLINELGMIGCDPEGGVSRLAFSKEDAVARERICEIMRDELGLELRIDAFANIFGRREGSDPNAPPIISGSHLDSVKNGGKFDGPAGVVAAVEAIRAMNELGIATRHPIDLAVMQAEEPNAFGFSTFGSRGITGKLTRGDLEGVRDDHGTLILDALKEIGGDPDDLESALVKPGQIRAYIELHIEQMTGLERAGVPVGLVTGLAGIHRETLKIHGEAKHSGTTPMIERKDALVATAGIVSALDRLARMENGKATATVGQLEMFPNASNIIPGRVEMVTEVRYTEAQALKRVLTGLRKELDSVRGGGFAYDMTVGYHTEPMIFSAQVGQAIREACEHLNMPYLELTSMAGHDAHHMAGVTESGMIFVPSKNGLSHCPEEWTDSKDLAKGAMTLLATILNIDKE